MNALFSIPFVRVVLVTLALVGVGHLVLCTKATLVDNARLQKAESLCIANLINGGVPRSEIGTNNGECYIKGY